MPELKHSTIETMLYHAASCAGAAMAAAVWHQGVHLMPDGETASAESLAKTHALHGSARSYVYELDRARRALEVAAPAVPMIDAFLKANSVFLKGLKQFRHSLAHADDRLQRIGNRGAPIPEEVILFLENLYDDVYETTSQDGERILIKINTNDAQAFVSLVVAAQKWVDSHPAQLPR